MQTKADLDYETKQTYTVTVTATDPSDYSDDITVTIAVTDVRTNRRPHLAAPTVESGFDQRTQQAERKLASA